MSLHSFAKRVGHHSGKEATKPTEQHKHPAFLLAVTDLLTGLLAQPSFVIWKTFYVLKNARDITAVDAVKEIHNYFLRVLNISSSLHLILLTCERLLAIKYTNHYSYIVRKRNFKVSVLAIWSFLLRLEF